MNNKPYCPVDAGARAWFDYRWYWLLQQFGTKGLKQRPVILPTPEFFPNSYEGKSEDVEALVHHVAKFMDVDPATLEVHYYEETPNSMMSHQKGTMGMYVQNEQGKFEIWLEVSHLHEPKQMIATIAHELGHVLLLGQGRITGDAEDHEPLTDLLTVFYGLGVFLANTALHENYWSDGGYSSWTIGKRGYLTMNQFGYAFALMARSQGESKPPWLKHLRLDVRKACLQSLVHLPSHLDLLNTIVSPARFPAKQISSESTSILTEAEAGDNEDVSENTVACIYCNSVISKRLTPKSINNRRKHLLFVMNAAFR